MHMYNIDVYYLWYKPGVRQRNATNEGANQFQHRQNHANTDEYNN